MENNYKTIVYMTVNTVNNKIYIGIHNTENPDKFDGYIGNGVNVFHPYTIKHPTCPFHYAVKKYGFKKFKRYILQVFDNREDALKLEKILVNEDFIRRDDTYNITLGGGDPPHYERKVYQYDLSGNFIKEYLSIVAAEKALNLTNGIVSAIKYKTLSAGYLWSYEKVDKLNINEYKIICQKKPLYLYDTKGKFIREYRSISQFCKEYKVTLGPVQRAIKGKTKIAGFYVSDIKVDTFVIEKHEKQLRPIHQYSLDGKYLATYPSGLNAYKTLGKGYSQIVAKLKLGNRICGDYQWSFEKLDHLNPVIKYNSAKKIAQCDLKGNIIKIYDTVRECRKDFGNVSRVLSGKCSQCKGYTFKYV